MNNYPERCHSVFLAARQSLRERLRASGICTLVVTFDESHDEGEITGYESSPAIPNELQDELDELVYQYLDIENPGGECGRGQFGHVYWDLNEDTLSWGAEPHAEEED